MSYPTSFAIWITGLPASGKSTITKALLSQLESLGCRLEVLESDTLRKHLTPAPTYSPEERELFYRSLAFFGSRLVAHGVTVVFDATANKRRYRDLARSLIPCFFEVAVECPLDVCMERDQKGTYRKGQVGESLTVPGLQDVYEPPLQPDIHIHSQDTSPMRAADLILATVSERFLSEERKSTTK